MRMTLITALAGAVACVATAATDTRSTTPTMGWSSWNTYRVNISDTLIMRQATEMKESGLADAGYTYINIDDGHFGHRDADGTLKAHPTRFPEGLRPVTDHIHQLGLKAGIYSDAGRNTCGSFWDNDSAGIGVGLYGFDDRDAVLYFDSLRFDFIKVDFCGGMPKQNFETLTLDPRERYTAIAQAIARTGRDVRMNICRWAFPGTWAADIAGSWRISGDINPSWNSVKNIIDRNLYLSAYASPGHFNDMDMLEIGRGMTADEDYTHMAMWCMMSSPLLIGCDMTTMSDATRQLLTDRELIAINQDPAGMQARVVKGNPREGYLLVRDLDRRMGPRRAIAFYNPTDSPLTLTATPAESGYATISRLRDVTAHSDSRIGDDGKITATVPPHGCRVFTIEGKRTERDTYQAATAILGDYQQLDDTPCSHLKWGNSPFPHATFPVLGKDAYIEWPDIETPGGGRRTLRINALTEPGSPVTVEVNGTTVANVTDIREPLEIDFPNGLNRLRLYSADGRLPDIQAIGITRPDLSELPLPAVPASLRTPEERAAYVLTHYWDAMDFADTTIVRDNHTIEERFATYASLFPIVGKEELSEASRMLLHRAEADTDGYNLILSTAETYLGEKQSPVYNPEAYTAFLEAAAEARHTDAARLARIDALLAADARNRPGTEAADFAIELRGADASTLHRLAGDGVATLLLFHDPDCDDCSRLIRSLRSDSALNGAIDSGRLRVIAVDLSGDRDKWVASAGHIPANWTDAFSPDAEVAEQEIYVIQSYPSLYLIGPDLKVILRDTTAADALRSVDK